MQRQPRFGADNETKRDNLSTSNQIKRINNTRSVPLRLATGGMLGTLAVGGVVAVGGVLWANARKRRLGA